jgi:hypothetical protein
MSIADAPLSMRRVRRWSTIAVTARVASTSTIVGVIAAGALKHRSTA